MQALQVPDRSTAAALAWRPVGDPAWRRIVHSNPDATLFHHPDWAILLARTYGYEPVLLVLEDGAGEIRSGALFLSVRSRLTGHRLISLPFTDHSPVLAGDGGARADYTQALVAWRRLQGPPAVEIHADLPSTLGVHPLVEGVRHLLPLDCAPGILYRSFKGTQVDRAIRKADRSGVTVRLDRSAESMSRYYDLHCLTRKRQGVPVQPRRFFGLLWSSLVVQGRGLIALAEHGGAAIAGAVFLGWNRHLIYKYGASDPGAWQLRPNNLLFWRVMEWACAEGYAVLDFGKTELSNRGLRDFKARWGAIEVPLTYSVISDAAPRQRGKLINTLMARVLRATPPVTARVAGELLYRHVA